MKINVSNSNNISFWIHISYTNKYIIYLDYSAGNPKKEKHSFSGVCSKKLEGLSGRMRQFSVQFWYEIILWLTGFPVILWKGIPAALIRITHNFIQDFLICSIYLQKSNMTESYFLFSLFETLFHIHSCKTDFSKIKENLFPSFHF